LFFPELVEMNSGIAFSEEHIKCYLTIWSKQVTLRGNIIKRPTLWNSLNIRSGNKAVNH